VNDPALQELLDKHALYEVVVRYCRAVDRGDEELLRTVYWEDARDEHGYVNGTPDEFIRHLRETSWSAESIKVRVQHALTNWTFEIDGDVAYGESYVEVRDSADGELNIRGVARYVDRFERRDGEWRISQRRVVPDWLIPGIEMAQFTQGSRDRRDPSYERA
jgi:SnoaL-like domain